MTKTQPQNDLPRHAASRLGRCFGRLGSAVMIALLAFTGCNNRPSKKTNVDTKGKFAASESVVLIVLDTVRADHLSACGYHRPTTPFIEKLQKDADYSTCGAYTPGSWTMPSHASYFTGKPVYEHGVDRAEDKVQAVPIMSAPDGKTADKKKKKRTVGRVVPLEKKYETLAEYYQNKGYHTVLVSSNPVLTEASGLRQGFAQAIVAETFGDMYKTKLLLALKKQLRVAPKNKPLFMVINISDAHGPWQSIPKNISWLPQRKELNIEAKPGSSMYKYITGTISSTDYQELHARYTDVYDYGIYRADWTLARAFGMLKHAGILDGKHRMVITADHGELLAEKDTFAHGGHLYEGLTRVPFMYFSDQKTPPFNEPLAAINLYALLKNDAPFNQVNLPAASAQRVSLRHLVGPQYPVFDQLSTARWIGDEKYFSINGEVQRFNLKTDPNEANGAPVDITEPIAKELNTAAQALQTKHNTAAVDKAENDELMEQLKGLGYVH